MYSSWHKSLSFPRKDYSYAKDRSLNFDLLRTKVFKDRHKSLTVKFMEWSAYAITGLLVGLVAACMTNIEHHLIHFRKEFTDKIINGDEAVMLNGWLFFSGL